MLIFAHENVRKRLSAEGFIEFLGMKKLDEIRSWDRFDMKQFMTLDQISEWIKETRHKVMYRDESKID